MGREEPDPEPREHPDSPADVGTGKHPDSPADAGTGNGPDSPADARTGNGKSLNSVLENSPMARQESSASSISRSGTLKLMLETLRPKVEQILAGGNVESGEDIDKRTLYYICDHFSTSVDNRTSIHSPDDHPDYKSSLLILPFGSSVTGLSDKEVSDVDVTIGFTGKGVAEPPEHMKRKNHQYLPRNFIQQTLRNLYPLLPDNDDRELIEHAKVGGPPRRGANNTRGLMQHYLQSSNLAVHTWYNRALRNKTVISISDIISTIHHHPCSTLPLVQVPVLKYKCEVTNLHVDVSVQNFHGVLNSWLVSNIFMVSFLRSPTTFPAFCRHLCDWDFCVRAWSDGELWRYAHDLSRESVCFANHAISCVPPADRPRRNRTPRRLVTCRRDKRAGLLVATTGAEQVVRVTETDTYENG